jgi:hypothetical protein
MNERIKEIIEKVGTDCSGKWMSTDKVNEVADLILADVCAIIEDPKSYNRCVFTNFDADQSRCVAVELVKEINQKLKDVK